MNDRENELLQRLRDTFRVEAQEHVQAMASGLVELERGGAAPASGTLDGVFRAAHSLKGAARAVNIAPIESLCQSLESVFAALKRDALAPSAALFDVLHRALGMLSGLLAGLEGSAAMPPPTAVTELRRALHEALSGPRAVRTGLRAMPAAVRSRPWAAAWRPNLRARPATPTASPARGAARRTARPRVPAHPASARRTRFRAIGTAIRWGRCSPPVPRLSGCVRRGIRRPACRTPVRHRRVRARPGRWPSPAHAPAPPRGRCRAGAAAVRSLYRS